jgi:predicted RNA-binding protein with PIN domain
MHNGSMTRLVVDGMNVIGSRPDGWWRDRTAAVHRLLLRLQAYAASESVEVTLVLDGWSSPGLPQGEQDGVRVLFARDAGLDSADDRIVALLHEGSCAPVEVVTSDRALQQRVRKLGASVGSPRTLLRQFDAFE